MGNCKRKKASCAWNLSYLLCQEKQEKERKEREKKWKKEGKKLSSLTVTLSNSFSPLDICVSGEFFKMS